jgi:DNA-binding NtrC family response regulator
VTTLATFTSRRLASEPEVPLKALTRIYLFEDDASLRSLLVEMLHEELDAAVEACSSVGELRQRCDDQRPDLIIADFWGASHLQLVDSERAEIAALAAVAPLVLVSGRNWAVGAEADDLGVAALVPKPMDIERFASVIAETLAEATQRTLEDEQAIDLPPREGMSIFVLGWPHS